MDFVKISSVILIQVLLLSCSVVSVDPEANGLVQRLISQRNTLIQPGLSFINSSSFGTGSTVSLSNLRNITSRNQISCIINVENWSKWLLGDPVFYFKYGSFLPSKIIVRFPINLKLQFQSSILEKCSPATEKLQ